MSDSQILFIENRVCWIKEDLYRKHTLSEQTLEVHKKYSKLNEKRKFAFLCNNLGRNKDIISKGFYS